MLDRDLVAHLGRLARLRLEKGEVERLTRELGRILAYVRSLDEIDPGAGSSDLGQPEGPMVLREDRVEPGPGREEVLSGAPEVSGGEFIVPAVFPRVPTGPDGEE